MKKLLKKELSHRDKILVENKRMPLQPESRQGRDMGENGNDILSLTGQGEKGLADFSTNMMSLLGQGATALCLNLN